MRTAVSVAACAALGCLAYVWLPDAADWAVHGFLGMPQDSRLASAAVFFLYDTGKILLLLASLIYAVALLRAALDLEAARDFLAGRGRAPGYCLGAALGAVTPFCSCSGIPLFLGFTTAGIPFGITMAFLITSPIVNEVALVMLWGLLGGKLALAYAGAGLAAGVLGGALMDAFHAERWLRPFFRDFAAGAGPQARTETQRARLTWKDRHVFALRETRSVFRRVAKWVVVGVAVGAALHGFVPDEWFAERFGSDALWTVPAAVLVAIPLYSNVTGIVPVMESLLLKGLPVGTTIAFCMSAVAASLPEFLLLRQIMTARLQTLFVAYLWVAFTLVGWGLNAASPWLF